MCIGRFGLAAFLVALAGTMTQGGNMWFDGFAGPWLAEVAPQAIDSEKTITLVVGALAAYVLFALGWMLFGIALLGIASSAMRAAPRIPIRSPGTPSLRARFAAGGNLIDRWAGSGRPAG